MPIESNFPQINREQRELHNQKRRELRAALLEKMRTNPTMKDSETLRLVELDISFWESQTDYSVAGLLKTLEDSQSLNQADDQGPAQ